MDRDVRWEVFDRVSDSVQARVQAPSPVRGALPAGQRRERETRVRLSEEEYETIHKARGDVPFARWIRETALKAAQTQKEKKP